MITCQPALDSQKEKVPRLPGDLKLSEFFFYEISSDLRQHLWHCMTQL